MNYFEFHIGDYAEATAHLSFVEDAAYCRLIRKVYATEGALPADIKAVQRLVGARTKEEREAVETVLNEFFTLMDDGWHQVRCDAEITRYQDKQDKARRSANARWKQSDTHSEGNANASPDAMRTHSEGNALQTPDTRHHITTSSSDVVGGAAPSAAPTTPPASPPDFDGHNAEALNGKAVVKLAEHWELPEPWGIDAEALGFQVPTIIRESEKFRQYWVSGKGKGTRRSVKGWRQTWSNWLEKAARDAR